MNSMHSKTSAPPASAQVTTVSFTDLEILLNESQSSVFTQTAETWDTWMNRAERWLRLPALPSMRRGGVGTPTVLTLSGLRTQPVSFYLAVLMLCFGCGCRIYDGLKPGLRTAASVMGKIQEWTARVTQNSWPDFFFLYWGREKRCTRKLMCYKKLISISARSFFGGNKWIWIDILGYHYTLLSFFFFRCFPVNGLQRLLWSPMWSYFFSKMLQVLICKIYLCFKVL